MIATNPIKLARNPKLGCLVCLLCVSCAIGNRNVMEPTNDDHLIGKKFSESIYKGRQVYKVIRETDSLEELENRRSDGCIMVYGVRKKDDIIEYWRVDSGIGTCKVTRNGTSL